VVRLENGETVCLIGNPLRLFDRWMAALGADPPATAPSDDYQARAVIEHAASRFADAASLQAAVSEHGLVCSVVQSATAMLESDWAEDRAVLGLAAPGVQVVAAPWRSSSATIGLRGYAPPLGADTAPVLEELLGLGDDEIRALTSAGVVR
jgi:crotonobetainyl-CoA:carnitine CoA-transferase CaiB-like acyl-CoA transferase